MHPSHGTRTTTIRQSSNLALPSEIPDNRVSGAASCSERVLDMVVPCKSGDLVELGTARTGRVWLAWIFKIPNIDLRVVLEVRPRAHINCTYLAIHRAG